MAQLFMLNRDGRWVEKSGVAQATLCSGVKPLCCEMLSLLVRMIGLEPTLPCGNWNLNPARLPVSPHPHGYGYTRNTTGRLDENHRAACIHSLQFSRLPS